MSTSITWGPELGSLSNDVRDCYPNALGLGGLDKFPLDEVPNL